MRIGTRTVAAVAATLTALLFCAVRPAAAQTPAAVPTLIPTPAAPTATPLPQHGELASTSNRGFGNQSNPDVWGGTSLDKGNPAPISGSVSRTGPGSWTARVFNNSKDSYSADIQIVQTGKLGNYLKQDSFSVSLAPGASSERTVSAATNSAGASLNLRGWKKTTRVPPTPTAAAAPAPGAARKPKTNR